MRAPRQTTAPRRAEALLFAAAYPIYYAGVIVRGDATDVSADLVPNLASTFVYVVQTGEKVPPVVQTLEKGGHPADKLKVGPPTAMAEWLASVKRVAPKAFKWVVKDRSAHRLAHWILSLIHISEATRPY